MVAIGLAAVPAFARVARAGVLAVKAQPYIEAARALGMNNLRIMLRHVLPNILGPLVVQASLAFAASILAEAALSYLGLGTQPPTASWGRMLREAQSYQELSPYPVLWPGIAIGLAVLGFNLLGDGLRDWLDPRKSS
jgi:peptide/nickel transport system permease protein